MEAIPDEMDLRVAIIDALSLDRLRALADRYGLSVSDRRRRAALGAALFADARGPGPVLADLSEVEVKSVCARVGLPTVGRKAALIARLLEPSVPAVGAPSPPQGRRTFVAIDFETADHGRDSACAVAMVRVEAGAIVSSTVRLICPPRSAFQFTWVHGISWAQVAHQPCFGDLWPALASVLEGASFLAAHNAPFDRSVLNACCVRHGLRSPTLPFVDTVKVARQAWSLNPAKLPDVCRHLKIPLRHHDPASDAEACARIVIAAGVDRVA